MLVRIYNSDFLYYKHLQFNYINMVPVESELVDKPLYSSARDYAGNKGLSELIIVEYKRIADPT